MSALKELNMVTYGEKKIKQRGIGQGNYYFIWQLYENV